MAARIRYLVERARPFNPPWLTPQVSGDHQAGGGRRGLASAHRHRQQQQQHCRSCGPAQPDDSCRRGGRGARAAAARAAGFSRQKRIFRRCSSSRLAAAAARRSSRQPPFPVSVSVSGGTGGQTIPCLRPAVLDGIRGRLPRALMTRNAGTASLDFCTGLSDVRIGAQIYR